MAAPGADANATDVRHAGALRYGVTVKLIEPKIPVVGSVAITWNVVDAVGPDVVDRNPVVGSILTFVIEVGLVLQVTEFVTSNVPLPVVAIASN